MNNNLITEFPLLSIIIPVYNSVPFLQKCVDSILSQTYPNIEIILVNDGSTDESGLLLEQIKKTDNRIRVFHQENQGPSIARNLGMEKASGDFIAFVDSDDILYSKESYNILMQHAIEKGADMVIGNMIVTNTKGEFIKNGEIGVQGEFTGNELKQLVILDDWIAGGGFPWNRVTSLKKIKEVTGGIIHFNPQLKVYEDKCWLLDVWDILDKIYITQEIIYNYVIHSSSLSHFLTNEKILNVAEAYKCMIQNFKKNNEINQSIYDKYSSVLLWVLWKLRKANKKQTKHIWKEYRTITTFRKQDAKYVLKNVYLYLKYLL